MRQEIATLQYLSAFTNICSSAVRNPLVNAVFAILAMSITANVAAAPIFLHCARLIDVASLEVLIRDGVAGLAFANELRLSVAGEVRDSNQFGSS